MNDLDDVLRFELYGIVFRARDDLSVAFHCHRAIQAQVFEKAGYGRLVGDLVGFSVHCESHGLPKAKATLDQVKKNFS